MIIFNFINDKRNPVSLQVIRQIEVEQEIGFPQALVSFYCNSDGAYIKKCAILVNDLVLVPLEICKISQVDRKTSLSENYVLLGFEQNGCFLWNIVDGSVYFYNTQNGMPIHIFNSVDDFFNILDIAVTNGDSIYDVACRSFRDFNNISNQNQHKTRCLSCNMEIPINSKNCPYCNSRIRKAKKSAWPTILICFFVFCYIIGITDTEEYDTDNNISSSIEISDIENRNDDYSDYENDDDEKEENINEAKLEKMLVDLENELMNQPVDTIEIGGLSEEEKNKFDNAETIFAGVKKADDAILLPLGNSSIAVNLYIENVNYKEISNSYDGYTIETAKGFITISLSDYWEKEFIPVEKLYLSTYHLQTKDEYEWDIKRENNIKIEDMVFECYRETDKYSEEYYIVGVIDDEYYLKIDYYEAPEDVSDFIKDLEVIRK